jgi:ubiquitin-protein ligase
LKIFGFAPQFQKVPLPMTSRDAQRRLLRDFQRLKAENPTGFTAAPDANNMQNWKAVIFGPDGTDWQEGTFGLTLKFPDTYPHSPPDVRFVPAIFHPNVYTSGAICLDILQGQWSCANDVCSVLISIQSLLTDPNPSSPANGEAASLFTGNRAEYSRRVRRCVEQSWNHA